MLISSIQNNSLSSSVKVNQSANVQNLIQNANELQSDSFVASKTKNVAFKGLLGDFAKITGLGVATIVVGAVATPVVGAIVLGAGALKLLSDDSTKNGGGSNKSDD